MVSNTRTIAPKSKKVSKDALLVKVADAKTMVKGSVEKINRDLEVVRGMKLPNAMNYLYFSPFGSAPKVAKLLKSAAANAENAGLVKDLSELVVGKIWANKAFQLKRMRAGSRGRPSPRRKSYSWVTVELAIEQS